MSAIFVSHSSCDKLVSAEINQWLVTEGHRRVFLDFDPEAGIPAGRSWERELYQELRSCRAVIVLWSKSSMASKWCFAEITQARSLGKALIPVKIDGCKLDGLLAGQQAIDFTEDKDEAFGRLRQGLLAAGLDPADAFDWDKSRAPYPGLLAFQERDAAVFFGRDEEIGAGLDLMNRVHHLGSAGMALVVGASGSGKSSLVRAGLIPRLRRDRDRWLVVDPIRPRNDPVAELTAVFSRAFWYLGAPRDRPSISVQLNQSLVDPKLPNPLVEMADELRRLTDRPDAKLLLVVDQFEELLGPTADDTSPDVLAMLRAACQALGFPVVMLGTLRADFLGMFQKHPALVDMRCELLQVGPMSPDDITKIIEEPANVDGVELESGLAATMLADSATEDALPLLAFTLRELYDRFSGDRLLALDEYHELGGVHGAVARVADDLFEAQHLTPEQQHELRHAFLALVRLTEDNRLVRRVARWDEFSPDVQPILDKFVDARLLVADSSANARTVEVAHEALFRSWRRLADWLKESDNAMRLRREIQQAAAGWERNHRQPEDLWRGTRLARAAELTRTGDLPLDDVDTKFIDSSLRAEAAENAAKERKRRRKLQTAIGLAVVGAVLAGVASVFFVQARLESNRAEEQARRSSALSLAAQASQVAEENPALALAIAAEASRIITPALPQASAALFEARRAFGARGGQQIGGTLEYHAGAANAVAFSPDGRLLASAGREGTVRLWDPRDGKPVGGPLDGQAGPVFGVAFSADGQLFASAGDDGTVQLWDPQAGSRVGELPGEDGAVLGVAFNGDRMLAAATQDGTVRLWDLSTNSPESEALDGHIGWVEEVAFSPDGRMLASAGSDGTIHLWDPHRGTPTGQINVRFDGDAVGVEGLAFSPDGRLLASAGVDGTVRLWDPRRGTPVGEPLRGHADEVWGVAFGPDGRLASAGEDGTVRLWDPNEHTQVGDPLTGHTGRVLGVAFSRDGMLASAGTDETVRLWDPTSGTAVDQVFADYERATSGVAFSPDGILASAGDDGMVRLWDPTDGSPIGDPLEGHEGPVNAVAFSSNGPLASTGDDATVRLWDPTDGSPIGDPLEGHEGAVNAVAFSPDGRLLASAGDDKTVRLWNADDGNPVGEPIRGHGNAVEAVAFSSDGRLLASAGRDGTVRLWDPSDGSQILEPISADIEWVLGVAFGVDNMLASAGLDGMVRLWDPGDGSEVVDPLKGHDDAVEDVAFGPDGMLASAGRDGTVRMWSPSDGRTVGEPLEGHQGAAESLAFSPDGRLLASSGADGTVRVWDAPWDVDVACQLAVPYVTAAQLAAYLPPGEDPTGCDLDAELQNDG